MKRIYFALLMLLLISPSPSTAGENWDFIIAPYILIPSIEGDTSAGRLEGADLDVGPKNIVENLDIGGMIQLEAHHKSGFGLSMAYNFMDLGGGASGPAGFADVDADVYQGIFEGYGIYRVSVVKSPLYFYAGIRWWDMDIELRVIGIEREKTTADWVDPVIGLRWMPQIAENWHVILKGDIGGFGIESEFTWNLQGGIVWDTTDLISLVFQYRALSVDYSTGTVGTPDRFAYDTITHGPLFGLVFHL
jgi:hypothetical protein